MELTSKEINGYEQELSCKRRDIEQNEKYAYGRNPGIIHAEDAPKPDNRIPVPLAKSAITDIVGYAGRPGEIKTEYKIKDSDETDSATEYMTDMDEHNKEGIENSELMARSLSLGIAWELWWISDNNGELKAEYKILDNKQCLPVYSDDLKPKLIHFLRFWDSKDKDSYLDVYYPLYSQQYKKAKGSSEWVRNPDGDTMYPFKDVPVIPFRTSANNRPVFEAQKPIIDAFDKIVSRTQNEVDRYNALISLFPDQVDSEFIKKLTNEMKPYIDGLDAIEGDKWPRYMEKKSVWSK